ncbi:tRNA pseudouridine(38-40) synthase TruA, partial [Myxococcota bacterium]|nr:tRNA pseudouridine(38-40) synthase TruA [Myxococcota bacterium]
MERHTYRVELGYDGRAFAGFARQPGQGTVEGTLAAALAPLVPELEGVSVGGRTDRGVSATHQVVSFWSRRALDVRAIHDALAPLDGVVVHDVRAVDRWFHAQYSARARRYVYEHPADGLDARAVDRLLRPLVGTRCFSAFARDTPPGKTTVRRM